MKLIEGHNLINPPAGVPVWDIDPYAPNILANPAGYHRELRSKGPFAYIPKYQILACGRHEETKEVFSDHERFVSSRGVGLQDFSQEKPWRPPSIILEADPPDHTKTRSVMTRALSPRVVAGLKQDFRSTADKIVKDLIAKNEFEVVEEFAEIYPTSVFPKAVGLTKSDPRRLVDYGAMVFNALGPDNELRRAAMAKGPDIVPWITEQCQRENLTKDGIGALIYEAADSGDISHDQAGMLVRSLLSAGVDTTVTGIGNVVYCLANNPDAWKALKRDPKLTRPAIEEVLRLTSPVHSFCRTANLNTQVSGINIQEGTKILCVLAAANTDPEKWPDPDKFQVDRRPMGHLAFGVGIHGCVGQTIARAELEAAILAMIDHVDHIEVIEEALWRPNHAIHALDSMAVKFCG